MPTKDYEVLTKKGETLKLTYKIRSLKEEDIPKLMEIRRELKIHDASSCVLSSLILDPEGIKIVETEKGLYCVREEYRGQQIGIQIWNACMEHVGSRNAALNAVPEKMSLYRDRGGFPIVETEFTCNKNFTKGPVNPKVLSNRLPHDITIHPFQEDLLANVFEYDFKLMGYKRELALALSCTEEDSRTFVALKNGMCVGFGSIKRSCLGAGRISPLYAEDTSVAEALLRTLIMSLPKMESFAMMTVSSNVPAQRLLQKLGCPKKEELTRLYSKERIDIDTTKVFALMDLNLALF